MAFPNFSEFSASQWAVLAAGTGLATWGAYDIYRTRKRRRQREAILKTGANLGPLPGPLTTRDPTWEEACLTKYRKQGMTEREAFFACFDERQRAEWGHAPPEKFYGARSKSRKIMPKKKSTLDRILDSVSSAFSSPKRRRRRSYQSSLRKLTDPSKLSFEKWLSQVDWILEGRRIKRGSYFSNAHMRPFYNRGQTPRSAASTIVDAYAFDAARSRPSRRRASRKTLWIRRNVRRPGTLTRMLRRAGAIKPGQRIPLWIKKRGCKKPKITYKKIFGNIPPQAVARLFQRRACLARTFHQLPPSRGRLGAKRRRPKRKSALNRYMAYLIA